MTNMMWVVVIIIIIMVLLLGLRTEHTSVVYLRWSVLFLMNISHKYATLCHVCACVLFVCYGHSACNNSYHWNCVSEDIIFYFGYTARAQAPFAFAFEQITIFLFLSLPLRVLSCATLLICKVGQICAPIIQAIILHFRGCMEPTTMTVDGDEAKRTEKITHIHCKLRGNYFCIGLR